MSCLRISSRRLGFIVTRAYAAKATASPISAARHGSSGSVVDEASTQRKSSCIERTVIGGVNYLKGQKPVVALPDDQYPDWLWNILEPVNLIDDGPGGAREKRQMREENRQRIKDQNFMKTQ